MAKHPLTIIGNEGSPYSRKMRAVLRYRQIAHRWVVQMGAEFQPPPKVPVQVIPVLVWHDDSGAMIEAMVDSTPQIRRLEGEFDGRSIIPGDAVLGFVDALIEDYADEWGTKLMFHYRWTDPAGIAWAREHLMRQINPSVPEAQLQTFSAWFGQRQIDRRGVVGATEAAAPLFAANYLRLLTLLNALICERQFLFGARPSAADFALYGQLTQLCQFDPTSARIAAQKAPRVLAWVTRLEDLGGWRVDEGQWLSRGAALPALKPLLTEIAGTYLPFLEANARARAKGKTVVECEIIGGLFRQQTFGYQAKCYQWLREHHARLSAEDQAWLRPHLQASSCDRLLAG